jgi:hypothetical protein
MERRSEILAGVEVHGVTRSDFILRGALAAGAAYGAAAAGPYVTRALAQSSAGDIAVVNFALTLEYVESAFYKTALVNAKLATQFGAQEQAHVQALNQAVQQTGGSAVKAPATSFAVKDEAAFLRLASTLEETGVSAYNGAIPRLKSADLVTALASIAQVESRHAAAIAVAEGRNAAPAPFDRPIGAAQAQARVKPFVRG